MDDGIQTLSDAVARGDWLQVGVLAVIVLGSLAGAGLKVAGKPVPILDQIVNVAKSVLKMLPKKDVAQPGPDEKRGVEAVVPVEDEKKP